MKRLALMMLMWLLTGCATPVDVAQTKVAIYTHKDFQQAAAYAAGNGYTARAAVLTAIDAQITACENAVTANEPKALPTDIGPITAAEMLNEALGTGVPASIKVNCAPIPVPALMPFKLP